MNRILKNVLLVNAAILGISIMIPNEVTAQLFRWRGAFRNSCPPVCCTADYRHGSHDGYGRYGTAPFYGNYRTIACCEGTIGVSNMGGQFDNSYGRYQQESYDTQGNLMGNEWNNQVLFDAQGKRVSSNRANSQPLFDDQGNRIDVGNQLNNQQRFDAQGNRIDVGTQLNTQSQLEAQGNRIEAGNRARNQSQRDVAQNRVESDVRSNQSNTFDTNTNPRPQVAQGASEAILPTPVPGVRQ